MKRESPEIKDKKLRTILNTAAKVFFEKGFRKISVDEFCQSAGVSKMTFYKHFPNKEELVIRVFQDLMEKRYDEFNSLIHSNSTFYRKIEKLISMKLEAASEFSKIFLEDLFQSGSEFQKIINKRQEKSRKLFLEFYNMGVAEGVTSSAIDPDFFIAVSEEIINMGRSPSIVALYPDPLERTKQLTTFFFYGIFGKHNNHQNGASHEHSKN